MRSIEASIRGTKLLNGYTLKFSEPGDLRLSGPGVTIFVGPNNSGKSLILAELAIELNGGLPDNHQHKILQTVDIARLDSQGVDDLINRMIAETPDYSTSGQLLVRYGVSSGGMSHQTIPAEELRRVLAPAQPLTTYLHYYGSSLCVQLTGKMRFELVKSRSGGDLLGPNENTISALFANDSARENLTSLVKDGINRVLTIDPTSLGRLRFKLSDESPNFEPQSLSLVAREYYRSAQDIEGESDGTQCYVGILSAICSAEYKVILIDEPEAFLHPPLARRLGQQLSSLSIKLKSSLIASTHSSEFLMGCVEKSHEVQVVRLEYRSGKSKAWVIDQSELLSFLRKPLMRSANVISGLFHDGVVVCESDNDRAFYGEIYARLIENESSFPHLLFVNAQNKQTMRDIVGPMRRFGVPTAAIPDIDFLKDGGKDFGAWLDAAQLPQGLHLALGQQRSFMKNRFEESGKNMKTEGGIEILSADDRATFEAFLSQFADYGVFVVPHGEVENWLSDLSVPGKKTDWAVAMLERLGSDPQDPAYVRKGSGDVWEHLTKIAGWVRNPARKGLR